MGIEGGGCSGIVWDLSHVRDQHTKSWHLAGTFICFQQALKSGAAARLTAASGGGGLADGSRLVEEDVIMVIEGVVLCVSR